MSRSKDVVSLARRSPSRPANDLERAKQPFSLQLTGLDSRVGVARSSACVRGRVLVGHSRFSFALCMHGKRARSMGVLAVSAGDAADDHREDNVNGEHRPQCNARCVECVHITEQFEVVADFKCR
jgi:hypothetical protein